MRNILLPLLSIVLFAIGCDNRNSSESPVLSFRPILTDSTITQWKGKDGYWQYEDGVLTGESTPNNILFENTYFIWEKDLSNNFELRAEFRVSERGNSGINYNSRLITEKEFVLRGLQADIDGNHKHTGNIYEEGGRGTLAKKGEIVFTTKEKRIIKMSTPKELAPLLSHIDTTASAWNTYHIIVSESTIIHLINGQIMSIVLGQDNQATGGNKLGFQLHMGPPMKVEFRNIQLKQW